MNKSQRKAKKAAAAIKRLKEQVRYHKNKNNELSKALKRYKKETQNPRKKIVKRTRAINTRAIVEEFFCRDEHSSPCPYKNRGMLSIFFNPLHTEFHL